MPHQVGHEFSRRRPTVLARVAAEQQELQRTVDESISEICLKLNDRMTAASIDKELAETFENAGKAIARGLAENAKSYQRLLRKNDDTLTEIAGVFSDRIGDAFDQALLDSIVEDARKRADLKVPPGYKDKSIGDYLIWLQMIDYAKSAATDILFVADDKKEDWWHKVSKMQIGARPELREEFREATGRNIHFLTSGSIIHAYETYSGVTVSSESKAELEKARARVYLGAPQVSTFEPRYLLFPDAIENFEEALLNLEVAIRSTPEDELSVEFREASRVFLRLLVLKVLVSKAKKAGAGVALSADECAMIDELFDTALELPADTVGDKKLQWQLFDNLVALHRALSLTKGIEPTTQTEATSFAVP